MPTIALRIGYSLNFDRQCRKISKKTKYLAVYVSLLYRNGIIPIYIKYVSQLVNKQEQTTVT